MKVLVVDDNLDFAQTLGIALVLAGHDVEVALGGEECIELQRSFNAPVLVMDLFMPGMDGFDTMEAIRSEFPGTQVIVVSASMELLASDCLDEGTGLMGATHALGKPFELEALLEVLEAIEDSRTASIH